MGLTATDGSVVVPAELAARPLVLFFYPLTGVPGQPPSPGYSGEDWDEIPGARGCTPQSCGFRDLAAEFAARGVSILGVSTNTTEHQREFRERNRVPFPLLSDSDLRLTRAMALPTFEFPVESGGPCTLIRRMAIFADQDRIDKVFYPVFPPDQNARTVLGWIDGRAARRERVQNAAHALRSGVRAGVIIRPVGPDDLPWVREELQRNWGATQISSLGRWYEADALPAFVACSADGAQRIGLATYTPPQPGEGCEVITLSSNAQGGGVGGMLLDACAGAARSAGCRRLFLTTTNDNTHAIGFYQKRGWSLVAVHRGAMDKARLFKPTIPTVGMNGIALRDEIELELSLTPR